MTTPLGNLLGRLTRVRQSSSGYRASCPGPAHQYGDRHPSLSIDEGADGRVLVRCHSGCATEAILEAIGLTMADLFPQSDPLPQLPISATSSSRITVAKLAL